MDYVLAADDAYPDAAGAQGRDHPRPRQSAPAALHRRPHRPPGDPVRAEARLRQSRGPADLSTRSRRPRDMDAAIERVVAGLTDAGAVSAVGNRRAFRVGAGAARPLPPLRLRLRPRAGLLPLQPGADRQSRAQLGRQEPDDVREGCPRRWLHIPSSVAPQAVILGEAGETRDLWSEPSQGSCDLLSVLRFRGGSRAVLEHCA